MTILATAQWPTNAHMIADVAELGYLDGVVLDATYGEGNFWTEWQPSGLVTNDLYKSGALWHDDYKDLSHFVDNAFDTVVFDPPYKLSGTPALGEFDKRYGIEKRTTRMEVFTDIADGATECFRVTRKYLLVKCQDQVEGGKVRWQTDMVTQVIDELGGNKVDRFDFVYTPRPQPAGRRQVHASRNTSTLLVFEK